ncbi:hypothetical protein ACH4D5_34200 [Streptomyces sp. NPDC018029]|uniref:MmyB family transcriptional regulator n=1 Tax=Streptomyces sp. NPDC018029 TaxID=3365032 RepID=UPI0037AADA29
MPNSPVPPRSTPRPDSEPYRAPRPARDELKRFAHPVVGDLALRRQALTVGGAEQQVIIVYQATAGSPSEAALARLA